MFFLDLLCAVVCIAPLATVASIIFVFMPLDFLSQAGQARLAKKDRERAAKKRRRKQGKK